MKLTPESEPTQGFFRAKLDGSLWISRKEAVSHLLAKYLGKFYHKSSVTTEPPKGAFTVVAQCGMSGVLLGPPNHHEYTSKVIALHCSRFKNMPFEVYKSRIRMMRDETLIEQWKSEQSTKTVYTPLTPGSESIESEVASVEPSAVTPTTEAETAAPTAESVETTTPTEVVTESAPEEIPSAEVTEASESLEEGATAESTEEETAPEATSPAAEEGSLTLEEAIAHFQEHHADNEVETTQHAITLSGRAALHESTLLLRELLLTNLREMDRFPLPLAQAVGKELTGRGLQLFKSHKKIIHVSTARPRYLDRETTPIGENFRAILEYLDAHPNQHRDKQWAALLRLRTETVEGTPTAAAEPSPLEAGTESPATTAPGVTAPAPDAATLSRREQALGVDLLWLLHQGHVIDFAMGNLQAATRPAQKLPSKKELAEAAATESDLTPVAETAPVTEKEIPAETEAVPKE